MSIDTLLNSLERVKQTGQGRWLASCPTRNDKNPSMTIRELDDGRILIHDFGGSTPQEILDACGLTFADLFPGPLTSHGRPERRSFPATDLIRAIAFEALLVALTASHMANGRVADDSDRARLMLAAARIRDALNLGGVKP